MTTRRGSETQVGRCLTADANSAYKSKLRDCRELVRDLEKALDSHEKEQSGSPDDYGSVGDLGHVYEELNNVLRFLNFKNGRTI